MLRTVILDEPKQAIKKGISKAETLKKNSDREDYPSIIRVSMTAVTVASPHFLLWWWLA